MCYQNWAVKLIHMEGTESSPFIFKTQDTIFMEQVEIYNFECP